MKLEREEGSLWPMRERQVSWAKGGRRVLGTRSTSEKPEAGGTGNPEEQQPRTSASLCAGARGLGAAAEGPK